jgi:uncharacterized membrane protein
VTKSRLEAFSDGVLAIAITLLVIEIRPPELHGETLARALWEQWPSYVAYVVSFLTIGVIWLNHHRVFTQVVRVDGPLLVLNLNLLLWTALIPFPTAVVADYLGEGGEPARTAVALYGAVFMSCRCRSAGCSPGSPVTTGSWTSCRRRRWSGPPGCGSPPAWSSM